MADYRLVEMTAHFTPRGQYSGGGRCTWQMRREGRQVTGRGDYALIMDRYNFYNAGVREARLQTGNWMVLAMPCGERELQNRMYRRVRTRWMIKPQTVGPKP